MGHNKKGRGKQKCAREECQCLVGPPAEYCSDYCSGAEAMAQPELQCGCGHFSCESGASASRKKEL
jgi:hypothetical protein